MKHNVYGKKLGRDKNQRTALFRSLVRHLILHENIQTTETKVKAVKGLIDRLVIKARDPKESSKRVVNAFLTQPEVSKKLFDDIAPRFKGRTSGFTTTAKLGVRQGDGAMMVRLGWVDSAAAASKTVKADKDSEVAVIEEIAPKKTRKVAVAKAKK